MLGRHVLERDCYAIEDAPKACEGSREALKPGLGVHRWAEPEARMQCLESQARQPTIGTLIGNAVAEIGCDVPSTKGVLPKDNTGYSLNKPCLYQLFG